MSMPIKNVAGYAMDAYNNSFQANSNFYDLRDFIARCGMALADIYMQEYRLQYNELRSRGSDSLVTFDPMWLNVQTLEVESGFAAYKKDIMTFTYGNSSAGVQSVISNKPNNGEVLERQSQTDQWQMKFVPVVNKIFFQPEKKGIKIIKKGNCSVAVIDVYYVPAIGDDMDVPDAMVEMVVEKTAATMLQIKPPVVKETADGNQNMIMETEINKKSLIP